MNLKKRYFERVGTSGESRAVVETPLAPHESYDDGVDRSVTLGDLDFSIRESRKGFEEIVGSSKHFDVMTALQFLESLANSAIKKADVVVARLEGERAKIASAKSDAAEPINVGLLLELLNVARRLCPECGGIRSQSQATACVH